MPPKLYVHSPSECNCTAVWQIGKTTKCTLAFLRIFREFAPFAATVISFASFPVTRAEVPPSVVHHAFPHISRPYSSANSIHHPFQARICKHDQHKCTVSSPPCRDIGHREASKVDSGAQNSASSGILGTQATCPPSNLLLGSDLTTTVREGGYTAKAITGSREAFPEM